jgi:hypothetical protein
MSDRGQTHDEAERTIPGATRGRPGPLHEELYAKIMADVKEIVLEYAPTYGEVRGMDGGKVRVQIDGEDDEREVGFPRRKGQRYAPGDRVKVQKSRSGEWVADGTVSTKEGRDPTIGNEDLNADSVDSTQLKQNSVTQNAIAGDSVSRSALRNDVVAFIQDQGEKAADAMSAAKAAQNTADGKADKNHDHNYASPNHSHNDYADKNHNHSGYASSNHSHKISDITGLQKKLDDIETALKKK